MDEKEQLVIGSCFIDEGQRRLLDGDRWTVMGGPNGRARSAEHGLRRTYGSLTLYGAAKANFNVHMYTFEGTTSTELSTSIRLWHVVGKKNIALGATHRLVSYSSR